MRRYGYFGKIKSRFIRSKYLLHGAVLVFSSLAPLIISGSTATASATFTNYPTTSSYTPGQVTTANGSVWYVEGTSSVPNDYIGSMATSGTVTDYNISVPTGATKFAINSLTTGPDGNVWFDGCADTTGAVYAGFLDVSTGAVTFYKNTITKGGSPVSCFHNGGPGAITAGSDGYVWYVDDNYEAAGATGYLFSVDPSTGTTSAGYNTGVNSIPGSLTTGPDGRLWYTIPANNALYANTVSAGAITGGNVYSPPTHNSDPNALISGPDGNLWFDEDVTPEKVAKVTTSGSFTEYTVASGVSVGTLATGSDDAVWFVDNGSTKKIGRISSSGSITEYTVPGTSVNIVAPHGLTLGPDGAMWFTYRDSGGWKVGRLGY